MASDTPNPRSTRFETTCWSIVVAAGHLSSTDSRKALESLCEGYWYPLYAYVRRHVEDINEAQDLTQAFFAELLEKNYVGAADPERGRFRAFLLTALKHFLSKQREKSQALKRGGGRKPLSLDFQSADSNFQLDPAAGLTAEQLYDRQWTLTLLQQILQRLRQEYEDADKAEHFDELKAFVIGDQEGISYAEVANRLKMTDVAARKAASRMRQRYRDLLREEIAQTVCSPEEIDDEIRSLFASFDG